MRAIRNIYTWIIRVAGGRCFMHCIDHSDDLLTLESSRYDKGEAF